MAYIKLFKASDDSQISEAPTTTNAVSFTLRADLNEVGSWQRLFALADTGYVVSDAEITPTGTTAAKWQLCPDDSGDPDEENAEAYGATLELGEVGDTTKVYFHARAKATSDETPVNDVSVTLVASGVAAAE